MTFDLVTLKVVSESHVTWATSVPILVFLCLSVLYLGPMYATDKSQTKASQKLPPLRGGHNNDFVLLFILSLYGLMFTVRRSSTEFSQLIPVRPAKHLLVGISPRSVR